jgi:predicted DNA-binding protein
MAIALYGYSMSRKKLSTTVYLTPEQDERLKQLQRQTRVAVAAYIREGIDMVLEKYKDKLPGQQSLFDLK